MPKSSVIKNIGRGGESFHSHRREIVRSAFEGDTGVGELSSFLRDKLFALRPGWRAYTFITKDWDVADRLLINRSVELERRMLDLALAYVCANISAVARLYRVSDMLTGQVLSLDSVTIGLPDDALLPIDWQSRFGFQILCATNDKSSVEMRHALEDVMVPQGWCRSRFMYPLINQTVHRTQPEALDDSLEYFLSGQERVSERAALKLLLSNDAAHSIPFALKLFVGLMGHPFDMCEIILDHIEFEIAKDDQLFELGRHALTTLATLLPGTRAEDLNALGGPLAFADGSEPPAGLVARLNRYGLGENEVQALSSVGSFENVTGEAGDGPSRPIAILQNMRRNTYPQPAQFHSALATLSVWYFVDAGRYVAALLRSLYMIDRTKQDLESRDVLRLIMLFGEINPFIATAPSAIPLVRRLAARIAEDQSVIVQLERNAETGLNQADQNQRLWINKLQWVLRELQEEGRVQPWLAKVRSEAKVKPLYLTGINWPWVKDILEHQKLRPFRSFDGAYLLLLMDLESQADPQLLKLVLDRLLRDLTAEQVVQTLIDEYGEFAPALVTRYLTTANLLTSGRAFNHFAALNLRIEALETCIRKLGYNQMLPKEMYDSETKVLTAELLLLNVNAGKFEIPWEMFSTYAEEKHRDVFETLHELRLTSSTEPLSAFVETPRVFRNGYKEEYRYRRNDAALFHLTMSVIEDFLDHPAFGLEIILSGRFRHNVLLDALHEAVTTVGTSQVPPVTRSNTTKLSEAYRSVVERVNYQWCSRYLQTRRRDKPDGLFNLVLSNAEVNSIMQAIANLDELTASISVIVDRIKDALRPQVAAAGDRYVADMKRDLVEAFDVELKAQIAACDGTYRADDATRVHHAVLDAVLRKVEALRAWFDGVDAKNEAPVTLAQLAQATERLFENVLPGRKIQTVSDHAAASTSFEAPEVKVAFDLVREVTLNALKRGPAPCVKLEIGKLPGEGPATFVFANDVEGEQPDERGRIEGTRYVNQDDALTREGNSGRLKIASSAATLLGKDTAIEWSLRDGRYELSVPLRPVRRAGKR